MIEINKTYCRKVRSFFRHATVTRLDLMNNTVYYDLVDRGIDDKIVNVWPNQIQTITWFIVLYKEGICDD